jgi:hypothetical protein
VVARAGSAPVRRPNPMTATFLIGTAGDLSIWWTHLRPPAEGELTAAGICALPCRCPHPDPAGRSAARNRARDAIAKISGGLATRCLYLAGRHCRSDRPPPVPRHRTTAYFANGSALLGSSPA